MSKSKTVKKDLYYTKDHEWIDFQGTVAYIGVCHLKLAGIKQIQKIVFTDEGIKKQGEVVATVMYNDYQILIHMPADGKIIRLNDALMVNQHIILEQPEHDGWIAFIGLTQPYERKGLMQPEQYKLFTKRKF